MSWVIDIEVRKMADANSVSALCDAAADEARTFAGRPTIAAEVAAAVAPVALERDAAVAATAALQVKIDAAKVALG